MGKQEINFKTPFINGDPAPFQGTEMVAVTREKYADVFLCFRAENGNIPFAEIKLYDDKWHQKQACFESAREIAKEIEALWNAKFVSKGGEA